MGTDMDTKNDIQETSSTTPSAKGIYRTEAGTLKVFLTFEQHTYYLNHYATVEEAVAVRDEGQQHMDAGDFLTWFAEHKRLLKMNYPKDSMLNIYQTAQGMWKVLLPLNAKTYTVGTYATIEEAMAIRNEGHQHRVNGDFLEWLNAYKQSRHFPKNVGHLKNGSWKAYFVFKGHHYSFCTCKTMEEAVAVRDEGQQHIADGDFLTWLDNVRQSRDACKDIRKLKNGSWAANFNFEGLRYSICTYTTMEEAIAGRDEGQQHIAAGDFLTWLDTYKQSRNAYQGVYKTAEGTWRVNLTFEGHTYYLNRHATVEEALAVRDAGQQHIADGDFLTWFAAYKRSRSLSLSRNGPKNIKNLKNGLWRVCFVFEEHSYTLNTSKTKEEALAVRDEGQQHIAAGDFLTWLDAVRQSRKVCKDLRKTVDGTWKAYLLFEGRKYYLSSHATKEEALAVRDEGQQHIADGDFLTWFASSKQLRGAYQGVYKTAAGTWKVNLKFGEQAYYLNCHATKEEALAVRNEGQQHIADGDFLTWFAGYKQSRNVQKNINNLKNGLWRVCFVFEEHRYTLNTLKTKEEALAVRDEGQQHIADGDFLTWLAGYKQPRNVQKNINNLKNGLLRVRFVFKEHRYTLNTPKTMEEAIAVRDEGQQHIADGDFLTWLAGYKQSRQFLKHKQNQHTTRGDSSGERKSQMTQEKWDASFPLNGQEFALGPYATEEEAAAIQNEGQQHIADGDFLTWFYLSDKKRRPHPKLPWGIKKICKGQWAPIIVYEGQRYSIKTYTRVEDAIAMRAEALQHIQAGDFLAWLDAVQEQ